MTKIDSITFRRECPFCGNDKCTFIWERYPIKTFCFVQCESCAAQGPLADDEKAAGEAWDCRKTAQETS